MKGITTGENWRGQIKAKISACVNKHSHLGSIMVTAISVTGLGAQCVKTTEHYETEYDHCV